MPRGSRQYTVFGFSEQIDWRQLHFVEPIPPAKICSACGLVPRMTGFLPCRHVLCKPCYDRCEHLCPLDGELYPAEDVDWKEFPAEAMMKREVQCWNEAHGCSVATTASQISKHFHEQCEYHCTECPKCLTPVLLTDVGEHLRYGCRNAAASGAYPQQPTNGAPRETLDLVINEIKTALAEGLERSTAAMGSMQDKLNELRCSLKSIAGGEGAAELRLFKEACEKHVSELKIQLEKQSDQHNVIIRSIGVGKEDLRKLVRQDNEELISSAMAQTNLNENGATFSAILEQLKVMRAIIEGVSPGTASQFDHLDFTRSDVDTLKDTLRQQVQLMTQSADSSSGSVADSIGIKGGAAGRKNAVLNKLDALLWGVEAGRNVFRFKLGNYSSRKEGAMKDDPPAVFCGRTLYLSGYHLSAGVRLEKRGESVALVLYVKLHEGEVDEYLQWPFQHSFKLSVIHPLTSERCEVTGKADPDQKDCLSKPKAVSKASARFPECYLKAHDLERAGYLENDQLDIRIELVQVKQRPWFGWLI